MPDRVRLVVSLATTPEPELVSRLSGEADVLEVRADLVGDLDVDALRSDFAGELLYTLRSRAEGGASQDADETRAERLKAAAGRYDLVDLEGLRDARPEVLAGVPAAKRVVSWHGPPSTLSDLKGVFAQIGREEARYYKLVPRAERPEQALAPLALLHSLDRADLIAFAGGEGGAWTRWLAPRLGAPVIYAAAGTGQAAAPGQLPIGRLREDWGLPDLPAIEHLCGVVGRPALHSLSPRLHNGFYRRLGLPFWFLPFEVESFGDFWLEVVESGSLVELGFDLKGLSVTAPHKSIALAVAGATSPLAERINSANTLVSRGRVWEAESTDHEGVLGPLRARGLALDGRSVVVVGAGGAGRSAAFALLREGASVSLSNRGVETGRHVAADLGLGFVPLDELDPRRFEMVVHATPLGRGSGEMPPFDLTHLASGSVVIDLVYRRDRPTRLVHEARERGCTAIDGREVLLHQALPQFELMTGVSAPAELGYELLGLEAPE